MCEGICMQNEGAQEAVCEDGVREVERLMKMMRDRPKCETDTMRQIKRIVPA